MEEVKIEETFNKKGLLVKRVIGDVTIIYKYNSKMLWKSTMSICGSIITESYYDKYGRLDWIKEGNKKCHFTYHKNGKKKTQTITFDNEHPFLKKGTKYATKILVEQYSSFDENGFPLIKDMETVLLLEED